MHEEIKNKIKINDLFNPNTFEALKDKLLLFNEKSEYYKFSGIVTAALLDYEDLENKISILAIKTLDNWFTFKYSREDLIKMFNDCDVVIGNNPEDSLLIEK